jgi:hypothetical protein
VYICKAFNTLIWCCHFYKSNQLATALLIQIS